MFVPCDEFGFILERPNNYENWLKDARRAFKYTIGDNVINHNYRQALDRVIFEGFEVFNFWVESEFLYFSLNQYKTLEQLINEHGDFLTLKKPI